jgi:hypothetical protein
LPLGWREIRNENEKVTEEETGDQKGEFKQ